MEESPYIPWEAGGRGARAIRAGFSWGPLSRLGVCWTSSMDLPSRPSITAAMDMAKPLTWGPGPLCCTRYMDPFGMVGVRVYEQLSEK